MGIASRRLWRAHTVLNVSPVAHAGNDQSVSGGATVTLDGSGSTDSDGTIASYAWTQTGGITVTLSSLTAQKPTFTAPASAGNLTFSLVVTDNKGAASPADTVTIGVTAAGFVRQSSLAGAAALGSTNYAIPGSGVVYVATTGNDTTGTGTLANPYATFKKAATACPANGTIVMRAGSYHEGGIWWRTEDATPGGNATLAGAILSNAGVTIQNYPGEVVWFDGSEIVTGWTFDGTYWRLPFVTKLDRTQTHSRGNNTQTWVGGEGFVTASFPCAAYAEQLFMDGVQLTQVDTTASIGPGQFRVEGSEYGGTTVDKYQFISTAYVMLDNPTGHEMRISTLSRLATINKTDVTMRGIGIRRYAPALCDVGGMYIGSKTTSAGFTMENCIVEDISNQGVSVSSNNALVRHCEFRRCGNVGLGGSCDGSTYEYNIFEKNVYTRYNYGPAAGGVKVGKVWDQTWRYNKFDTNYGHALWFDESCYNNVIHGNDFINSYGYALCYEISAKGYIVDNLFINNGLNSDIRPSYTSKPIWISGSNNCEIWNNTIVNSEAHFHLAQDARNPNETGNNSGRDFNRPAAFYDGSDPSYPYNGEMTWYLTNTVFKNNFLYRLGGVNDVQSVFHSSYDGRKLRGTADFGLHTAGNLYNRISSAEAPRFANSVYGPNNVTHVHSTMTGLDHMGGVSWATMTGETGSHFRDNFDACVANAFPYTIKSSVAASVTPAPLDSVVAAKVGRTAGEQHIGAWLS